MGYRLGFVVEGSRRHRVGEGFQNALLVLARILGGFAWERGIGHLPFMNSKKPRTIPRLWVVQAYLGTLGSEGLHFPDKGQHRCRSRDMCHVACNCCWYCTSRDSSVMSVVTIVATKLFV